MDTVPGPPLIAARRGGLLLACALLFGCRDTPGAEATRAPVRIGVGAVPGAPGYLSLTRGMTLALEQLRAEGTRLVLRTASANAHTAVEVAQQLHTDPSVLAVVGPLESGQTLETVPIYADAGHNGADGIVVVSPTATSPRLSGVNPWFFRVAPSDADVARVAAAWVLDSLRARRAAVIYRNDAYGRDWTELFARAFAPAGEVLVREPYLQGVVEWDAYAALLAARRPEVVLFPGDAADALALIRALRRRDLAIPVVGGDGVEGLAQTADAAGVHYVTFGGQALVGDSTAARFRARFRERFGSDPDYTAVQGYDAALVIGRAARRGGRTRAALRLALEQVGSAAPAVTGAGGRISFRANHDVQPRRITVARVAPAAKGTR